MRKSRNWKHSGAKVRAAGKAYETADEELKKKLENPQEWKEHTAI